MKVLKIDNPQLVKMFKREVLTLQTLNHPGIPKVESDGYFTFTPHDSSEKLHCLVMQKMEGINLEQWLLEHGSISQSIALKWLRQILEILQVIHQHHLFHRDIKPSNIILQPDGQLALIDFGTVRDISNTYLGKIATAGTSLTAETGSITIMLSGGYTPPEQINGKALPQSDFYALGRTFVHLLTGKSPVELATNPRTGKLIWHKQAPRVSQALADFIDDLMADLPADRPQNAAAIIKYLNPKGLLIKSILRFVESPKFKLTVSAFMLVIVAGFLIQLWSRPLRASYENEEGRKALMDGDLESARKKLEKAVELNPQEAKYYNDLGLTCKFQKEYVCARDNYEKSLKLANDDAYNKATTHYNLGTLNEDTRKFTEAINEYQKAINFQNNYQGEKVDIFISAANNLARLQIWQNRNNQLAIELVSPYLEKDTALISPRNQSNLYKNIGWAYLQSGQLKTAEKYLKIAITKDVDNKKAAAYCLLAKVQVLQQINSSNTLQTWQKCRNYDDDSLPEVETWQLDAAQYLNSKGKSQ
ncbi:MAG: protein kinase [Nostocaceae cyanobacterium]|nr:protein kinase [Nostocaceae cyanobacterium]